MFLSENNCLISFLSIAPYGIREATERVGTAKRQPVIDPDQVASHIPSKIEYGLPQIFGDLLSFSAKHLKIDGRLVCWFPLFRYQLVEYLGFHYHVERK